MRLAHARTVAQARAREASPGGGRDSCAAAARVYHGAAAARPGPAAFPPAPPSGPAPQLRRTVLAGVVRVKGPRRTRRGGRDARAQRAGRQADDRRRGRRTLRPRRRPDLRRRLHHQPQPDGGRLRDRPAPDQGPAPGGALQRPGARRPRRGGLRAPPRHRLRRQRPLRADLHPLPQGRGAGRGAGRGLHQQHDEPALPGRRAEHPLHPQQVRAGDGRRRERAASRPSCAARTASRARRSSSSTTRSATRTTRSSCSRRSRPTSPSSTRSR